MKILGVLIAAFLVTSCASTGTVGVFTPIDTAVADGLAEDFVSQTKRLGLDSDDELSVAVGDDPMGPALEEKLRTAGFRVSRTSASNDDASVRYAVDRLKGTDLLRMTVLVADRRISRVYREEEDRLLPSGPWTVGEAP